MQTPNLFSDYEEEEPQVTVVTSTRKPIAPLPIPATEPNTEPVEKTLPQTDQPVRAHSNAVPQGEPTVILETDALLRLQAVARILARAAARAAKASHPHIPTPKPEETT